MRLSTTFTSVVALLVLPLALAGPTPLKSVEKFSGLTTGKYIVKLKPGVARKSLIKQLKLQGVVDWDLLNGFAGHLSQDSLNTLRSSEDVEYIAEDGIMNAFATQTQNNAPWGLQRINQATALGSSDTSALTYKYSWDDTAAGTGVDIYVADTGVFVNHTQFGGRARWGGAFGVSGTTDGHGHGTHCAGTAAGSQFGVAKNANIIAVKVLDDSGSGSVSGIVTGLDWIRQQVAASGRPSIVTMSLGGGASTSLDNSVAALTNAGIHVTVAAGNSNTDAANTSPARAPSAITVGASTIADARASFSNYGSIVDVFAPGQNVISAWIGSTTATNNISGTSMATPHIAGLVAYIISREGNASPAAIEARIKQLAVKGVLTSIPSGTANNFAQTN